jgi:hypothetical protein
MVHQIRDSQVNRRTANSRYLLQLVNRRIANSRYLLQQVNRRIANSRYLLQQVNRRTANSRYLLQQVNRRTANSRYLLQQVNRRTANSRYLLQLLPIGEKPPAPPLLDQRTHPIGRRGIRIRMLHHKNMTKAQGPPTHLCHPQMHSTQKRM